MKQFKKIYIEITNICNLNCNFCPPTTREKAFMSVSDFEFFAKKLRPHGKYLYLHVKGEPLMHKDLKSILEICEHLDFKVCLTTNGTLIYKNASLLLNSKALHKLHISLHSFEASDLDLTLDDYMKNIVNLLKEANFLVVLRLWNSLGENHLNEQIINLLKEHFSFLKEDKVSENIYLEHGEKFVWADLSTESDKKSGFCYALRNQVAVLVDGTVVPCCLDNNGDIALGNLNKDELSTILQSDRATKLFNGFSERKLLEKLCTTCGFIKRF